MSSRTDAIPQKCADVRYRVIGGQAVVIVQGVGEAIVLNEVGTRVLELVDGSRKVGEIARILEEEFKAERAEVEQDLVTYVADLIEAGVLET